MECLMYAEKMETLEYRRNTRKPKRIYKKARNRCRPNMGKLLHKQVKYVEGSNTTSCWVASCGDWRVILDRGRNYECFLWNSFSNQKIELPKIATKLRDCFSQCILTAPPTEKQSAVFLFWQDLPGFLYCKIGCRWIDCVFSVYPECIRYVAISCNGKVYATSQNKKVLCEFEPWSGIIRQNIVSCEEEQVEEMGAISPIKQNLVDAEGELFIVQRFSESILEVYKLDLARGKWLKVQCLGNLVFVLCGNHSVSLKAEEIGVEGNCIYSAEDDFERLYLFNLGDESLSISWNHPDSGSLWLSLEGHIPVLRFPDNTTTELPHEEALKLDGDDSNKIAITDESREEDSSIFSVLPFSLVGKIAEGLVERVDYMNFRLVCRCWSLIAPPRRLCHHDSTTTLYYPWLMSFSNQGHDTICSFHDPRHNVNYSGKTPPECPPHCVIRYAKDGWLLVTVGNTSVLFFQQFTKKIVKLPELPFVIDQRLCGMCFSGTPGSLECAVFGVRRRAEEDQCHFFFFLQSTSSNKWNSFYRHFIPSRSNPISRGDGRFSCLGEDGRIAACWLKGGSRGEFTWRIMNPHQKKLEFPTAVSQCYLVEMQNLPFISVFVGDSGRWVHVYRFRFDLETRIWEKLDNLGSHMLFVSETASLLVKVKDNDAAATSMKNRIYFPIFSSNNRKILSYSMDTASFGTNGKHDDDTDFMDGFHYGTKLHLNCTWF